MVATRTQLDSIGTVNQTTLGDAIKAAYVSLGFTVLDDYLVSTTRNIVVSFVADATKAYGTFVLHLTITSALATSQTIATAFNSTTKAFSNESSIVNSFTFSTSTPVSVFTYSRAEEYRFILLFQGSGVSAILGFLRPLNRPSWWNESTHPYAFVPIQQSSGVFFERWLTPTLTPFSGASNNNFYFQTSTYLASPNPGSGKRDILTELVLLSASSQGVAAKTSDDFAMVASSGLSRFDEFEIATKKWSLLSVSSSSGFAIKVSE